jgi:hypothetical protein
LRISNAFFISFVSVNGGRVNGESTGDREIGRSFQKTLRDCRIIRLPDFRFLPSVLSFVQPIACGSTRDPVLFSRLSIATPLALTEGPSLGRPQRSVSARSDVS